MIMLLRRRSFALLWFGGLISIMGDRVLQVALPFYVYQRSGSILASALMVAAELAPRFFLGSLAGVLVDRWDRKRVMVIASLGQGILLLPLLLVNLGAALWVVYLVSLLQTTLSVFFGPAENALLPRLVEEDELLPANALNAMNNNIARLVGPPLGGAILAALGLTGVVLFDSLTFVIAALMIQRMRVPAQAAPAQLAPAAQGPGRVVTSISSFWKEWLEGFHLICLDPVVTWLFITVVLLNFGGTLIDPLWVPYMVKIVGAGPEIIGMVMATQAVGGIAGGLAAGKISRRFSPALAYAGGEIILALVLFIRYNIPALPVVFLTALLTGLPAAIGVAGLETMFQQNVPNSHLGRISGMLNTTMSIVSLFGVLGIAGLLGDVLGVVPLLNLAAAATLLTGLLVLRFLAAHRPARQAGGMSEKV